MTEQLAINVEIEKIPSPPSVAVKLLKLFNDVNVTVEELGAVIQIDPALTAKIISYCNSPLMGSSFKAETLDRAITMLGMRTVRMLALSFSLVDISDDSDAFDYKFFWRKSLAMAVAMQQSSNHFKRDQGIGFLFGLMMNIGELGFCQEFDETDGRTSLTEPSVESTIEAENKEFGTDRFVVGLDILKQWNFPSEITVELEQLAKPEKLAESESNVSSLARVAWLLGLLLISDQPSLEEIKQTRAIAQDVGMSEEKLESIFAKTMEVWHEFAQLLEFDHDSSTGSLREIELAAKMKITEIALNQVQDQKHVEREVENLRSVVGKDALTGLNNRQAYEEQAQKEMVRCRRENWTFSLLVVDIDHFKKYNDTHGHQAGDDALVHVANHLAGHLRDYDNVYRYGGEEFVVTLPECDGDQAMVIAERLRVAVAENPFEFNELTIPLSVSIGIATSQALAQNTLGDLFEWADKCLYQAKDKGRNCCVATQSQPLA